jgi:AcrR family transcriptional regulator
MPPAVNRRLYDNTGRAARSAATRNTILDAARAQMLERGYRATTVASVAAAAGVNQDTVYALVGRKPVILATLVEQAISGTDRAVPAEDREYVIAIRAARDAPSKIAIYAAATTQIHERMAPLFLALRDAAATEPEAMSVWSEISARRAANMRLFASDLRSVGGLRRDLTVDEAGDIVWATNSAEVYVMLTVERGWTPEHYRRWLVDTWTRLLTE